MASSDEWSGLFHILENPPADKKAITKLNGVANLLPFRQRNFIRLSTHTVADQGELKRELVDGEREEVKGYVDSNGGPKGKEVPVGGESKGKADSGNSDQNQESEETLHSYLVLAVSFFSCFVTVGLQTSYGIIYQDLKSYYSADASRLSLPLATQDFMTHFGALFTSAFVNVFGLRAVGFIGGLMSAGGFIIAYFAENLDVFTVAYGLIVGTGFACIYLSASVSIQLFFDKRRSFATGVNNAGSALGVFAMSPLVRFLLNKYTWRGSMLIKAGIVLQCTWLWLLVGILSNEEQKKNHMTKDQNSGIFQTQKVTSSFQDNKLDVKPSMSQKLLTTLKETFDFRLFKDFHFTVYSIAIFFAQLGFPVTYAFAPDKGTDMGFLHDETKWFVSFTGVGGLMGRMIFGLIGNFPLLHDRRLHLHRLSVGLSGVSLVLVPVCRTVTSMYIILTIYGFAVGGHVVMTYVVLYDLFGSDVITRSFGLSLVMIGLASMVTTPLCGFVRDKTGAYDPVFFLAGGYFIMSMCIMMLIPVSRKENDNKEQYLQLP